MSKQIHDSISLRDIFRIFFSKKYVFFSIFLLIITITVLVIFLFSPIYTSSATILVKPSYNAPVIIGENVKRSILPVTMEYINNEVNLIKSHEVLKQTVLDLKLYEPNVPAKTIPLFLYKVKNAIKNLCVSLGISEKKDPVDKAIYNLKERIRVEGKALSNILVIRYSGESPEKNAVIVNTIGKNYFDKHIEVYEETGGQIFFNNQKKLFKDELDQAEKRFTGYIKKYEVIDPNKQIISNLSIQENLKTTSKNLVTEIRKKDTRIKQLSQLLSIKSLGSTTTGLVLDKELREVPGLIEYESALIALKIELEKAKPRFPVDSVVIQDIEKQIINIEKSMKLESQTMLAGDSVELKALMNKKNEISNQLNLLQKENLVLTEHKVKAIQFERDVKIAEKNYLLYTEKTEEARILAQKKRHKVVNITVVSPAVPATIPDFPKKKLLLFTAILVGTVAGLSGTVVANYLDHTLKTPQEIDYNTNLRLLGTVDYVKKTKDNSLTDLKKENPNAVNQLMNIASVLLNLEPVNGKKSFLFAGSCRYENNTSLAYNVVCTLAMSTPNKSVLWVENSHRLPIFSEMPAGHIFNSTTEDSKPDFDIVNKKIKPTKLKNLSRISVLDKPSKESTQSLDEIITLGNAYYDYVFFDFPVFSEKLYIANLLNNVDQVILVVEAGKTKWEVINYHTDAIINAGGNVAGAILNNRRFYIPDFIYKFL